MFSVYIYVYYVVSSVLELLNLCFLSPEIKGEPLSFQKIFWKTRTVEFTADAHSFHCNYVRVYE